MQMSSLLPKHEILVVDDDTAVRNTIVMLLKASGYKVNISVHGFDSLLQLKRYLPSVLFSDLIMPQMSCIELLSFLRRLIPSISVISMYVDYDTDDTLSF